MLKKIISFGFRHGDVPESGSNVVVLDIREMFRNPYRDHKLRSLRGTDGLVQDDIRKTPEFDAKVMFLKDAITVPGTEIAYIGCTGGHHRSVFLAQFLGDALGVPVEHRDFDKP